MRPRHTFPLVLAATMIIALGSTTVQRFERLADGAGEFMRYVQLGGKPRQHLFFNPLIGHIFAGKSLVYHVLHRGGQFHLFGISLLGKGMLVAHRICLLMTHYRCATGITPLELNSNGAPPVRH